MTQERLPVRKVREILRLKEEGFSKRAIARICKVSNSTVGEYLRRAEQAGLSWPLPDELSEEALYQRLFAECSQSGKKSTSSQSGARRRAPDWEEVHRELSKRGVSLQLLWQEYREQNPEGYGRTQFHEHYQRWNQAHTYSMRLPHKGGEAMEVDYAGMTVPITNPETGEIWQAQVFVAVLPASSYTYAEVQPSQELRHWLGGHVRAFTFFGGLPKIVRPDNLKSGIKTPNRYEPEVNPSYQELAEHYQLAVLPARVRKPKDKAHGENSVQNVERWVLAPLRNHTFFSLGEANRAVPPLLEKLNQREMAHLGKSRRQLFEELDRPALRPLPERPYEFATWKNAKVSIDYHVAFEGHYYSVPYTLVRQEVRIRASEGLVQIFHHGQQVALHTRSRTQGRFSTRVEHMPANHQFVRNVDETWFQHEAEKIGPQTAAYFTALLRSRPYPQQAYRSCLGILSLARKYTPRQLETVCQRLLPAHLLSYSDVKAELEQLATQTSPEPLPAHENVRGPSYYH
jgi:transposase